MKKFKLAFRVYLVTQFEKEEKWLNKMSEKGWQFKKCYGIIYTFTYDDSKVYEYKLQFIPGRFKAKKQLDYFNFMKSMGIEKVTNYLNWVYFRKEKSNEPFEIFNDVESTQKYIKQLRNFIIPLAYINLVCALLNIPFGIISFPKLSGNFIIGCVNLIIFITIMLTNAGLNKLTKR